MHGIYKAIIFVHVNDERDTKTHFIYNLIINHFFKFTIMTKSLFSFSVATPKAKGDVTTTPELWVTCTKDKFRLNGALTRKLGLAAGDRLMFITNEQVVLAAIAAGEIEADSEEAKVIYAIAKSVPVVKNGRIEMAPRRLTKLEQELFEKGELVCEKDEKGRPVETAFYGFKLASSSNAEGIGNTLEGSDATHWPALEGSTEEHRVYTLGEEIPVTVGEATVKAYVVEFARVEPKMEKSTDGKAEGETTVDGITTDGPAVSKKAAKVVDKF